MKLIPLMDADGHCMRSARAENLYVPEDESDAPAPLRYWRPRGLGRDDIDWNRRADAEGRVVREGGNS